MACPTSSAPVARCASLQRMDLRAPRHESPASHDLGAGRWCPHRARCWRESSRARIARWPLATSHAPGSHARSSHLRRRQPWHVGRRHPLVAANPPAAWHRPSIEAPLHATASGCAAQPAYRAAVSTACAFGPVSEDASGGAIPRSGRFDSLAIGTAPCAFMRSSRPAHVVRQRVVELGRT